MHQLLSIKKKLEKKNETIALERMKEKFTKPLFWKE